MKNLSHGYFIGWIFFVLSCQSNIESAIESRIAIDSTKTEFPGTVILVTDPFEDSLKSYFDSPIDFFGVKKNTQHMHTGYSRLLDESRLRQSKDTGTIFYTYWAVEFLRTHPDFSHSLQFITQKPWATKTERSYETDNEELVGIESAVSWERLGNSDFVGKTLGDIESKFGNKYVLRNECLAYLYADKILILSMKNKTVNWFKYYWLSESPKTIEDLPDYFFKWNNP